MAHIPTFGFVHGGFRCTYHTWILCGNEMTTNYARNTWGPTGLSLKCTSTLAMFEREVFLSPNASFMAILEFQVVPAVYPNVLCYLLGPHCSNYIIIAPLATSSG